MKILIVLTSHDQLGTTGRKTGFWLEEFAAPYFEFKDAGAEITLASPQGGQPPLDPTSKKADYQTSATRRFARDAAAQAALARTNKLTDVVPAHFDAVFYPGGHGPLWDLTDDRHSISLIEGTLAAGKPVGLVCHAPGCLRNVKGADGQPVVRGRRVTGFSNAEEAAVGLTDVVPFLLEDLFKAQGAQFSAAASFAPHMVQDGMLLTGQNPASSVPLAQALMKTASARQTAE